MSCVFGSGNRWRPTSRSYDWRRRCSMDWRNSNPNPRPRWGEVSCAENMNNSMIAIGRETYYMSGDGMLMPVRKNQPPPDLRYFKPSQK